VRTFPSDGQQTIDEEVNNAIVRAQGPIPMAKL
jgi:hypothetical protein